MPKWEYKHSAVPVELEEGVPAASTMESAWDTWVDHCAELGQDGWELIDQAYGKMHGEDDRTYVYFQGMFKRSAVAATTYLEAAAYLRQLAQMIEASTSS